MCLELLPAECCLVCWVGQQGRDAGELADRDEEDAGEGEPVEVDSEQALPDLPTAVEVAAFRIATEAMTNVARHARASTCRLRLGIGEDLTIEVSDNGVGMPGQHRQGVGISSMTERATEIGGDCVVSAAAGGGTVVVARLPLVTT